MPRGTKRRDNNTQYKAKQKRKKARRTPEFDLQQAFVKHLETTYPKALFCCSIAGVHLSKAAAGKCRAMGLRPGFPDFYIYEPRFDPMNNRYYPGLWIEFKAPGKKVKKGSKQETILYMLHLRGYCVRVINTLESAKSTVRWYLSLRDPSKKPLVIHDRNASCQRNNGMTEVRHWLRHKATNNEIEDLRNYALGILQHRERTHLIVL
jgi:hypothetical protein